MPVFMVKMMFIKLEAQRRKFEKTLGTKYLLLRAVYALTGVI